MTPFSGVTRQGSSVSALSQYGVPVALSTDDEGVARIDITHEFVRAAETYALSYADLKQMARTSLEHSFLPARACGERKMSSRALPLPALSDATRLRKSPQTPARHS